MATGSIKRRENVGRESLLHRVRLLRDESACALLKRAPEIVAVILHPYVSAAGDTKTGRGMLAWAGLMVSTSRFAERTALGCGWNQRLRSYYATLHRIQKVPST